MFASTAADILRLVGTLTGRINNTLVVPRNQRNRLDDPNLGSIVSTFSQPGVLPAAVTIPRPIGHSGVTYSGTYAGWLGARHDPMEIAAAAGGSTEKPTHTGWYWYRKDDPLADPPWSSVEPMWPDTRSGADGRRLYLDLGFFGRPMLAGFSWDHCPRLDDEFGRISDTSLLL